jgi:hypothetical protein
MVVLLRPTHQAFGAEWARLEIHRRPLTISNWWKGNRFHQRLPATMTKEEAACDMPLSSVCAAIDLPLAACTLINMPQKKHTLTLF